MNRWLVSRRGLSVVLTGVGRVVVWTSARSPLHPHGLLTLHQVALRIAIARDRRSADLIAGAWDAHMNALAEKPSVIHILQGVKLVVERDA